MKQGRQKMHASKLYIKLEKCVNEKLLDAIDQLREKSDLLEIKILKTEKVKK